VATGGEKGGGGKNDGQKFSGKKAKNGVKEANLGLQKKPKKKKLNLELPGEGGQRGRGNEETRYSSHDYTTVDFAWIGDVGDGTGSKT